jgi:hypothetical protein
MNFDDYISRDPMDGQWHRHAERPEPEPRREPCRYCVSGDQQMPWPPEAPSMLKCRICGDTHALREVSGDELRAAFAGMALLKGKQR